MHFFRPVVAFLGVVGLVLLVRVFTVPKHFGIQERGFMYGWHNKDNETWWKEFKVKYQGSDYCKDCHTDEFTKHASSPHRNIPCEDCHGPAVGHPDDVAKLPIDRSRALCERCHTKLPYLQSGRSAIKGFADPEQHNPGDACTSCHNPHHPNLEDM